MRACPTSSRRAPPTLPVPSASELPWTFSTACPGRPSWPTRTPCWPGPPSWRTTSPVCGALAGPDTAPVPSPLCWTASTPTMSAPSWTSREWPCAPATTVPCRSWNTTACPPPFAPPLPATTPWRKSTSCSEPWNGSAPPLQPESAIMNPELRALYQEMILDHGRRPRHFGAPAEYTHRIEAYNPLCGDRLTLYATVEGETITSLQFEGEGCAISEIEEHTSELQSRGHLVCRLLLEKQKEGIGQDLTERRSSTLTGLMTLSHATTVR